MNSSTNYHHNPTPTRKNSRHLASPLKAALIMLLPVIGLKILSVTIFLDIYVVIYLLECTAYALTGFMAGSYYYENEARKRKLMERTNTVRPGASAGLTVIILTWCILGLLIVIQSAFSFETALIPLALLGGGLGIVVFGPLDVILALCLGALGGRIARH